MAERLGVQRLWLHAGRLELRHPVSGAALSVAAEVGDEWRNWATYGLAV